MDRHRRGVRGVRERRRSLCGQRGGRQCYGPGYTLEQQGNGVILYSAPSLWKYAARGRGPHCLVFDRRKRQQRAVRLRRFRLVRLLCRFSR